MSGEPEATADDRHRWVVATEFSTVTVSLCDERGTSTVRVEDANSDAVVDLDALELEALARSTPQERLAFYRQVMCMAGPLEKPGLK